jgi:error-prone DNA polymerase
MGFRYVKGLGERQRERLGHAFVEQDRPFTDLDDFVRRTRLGRKPLLGLAESGAFESFGVGRRDALWAVRGALARVDDALALPDAISEGSPRFRRLGFGEEVLWDYRASQHSPRGHPMVVVRRQLDRQGLPDAAAVNATTSGRRVRYVGMVICRQRPQTASGVTFYTLEDETGFVNLVVWRAVFERHEVFARTAILVGVTGKVEASEGVTHLIADELWDPRMDVPTENMRSRDFH